MPAHHSTGHKDMLWGWLVGVAALNLYLHIQKKWDPCLNIHIVSKFHQKLKSEGVSEMSA